MALEGMEPFGMMREAGKRLKAREERFLKEKEPWEARVKEVMNKAHEEGEEQRLEELRVVMTAAMEGANVVADNTQQKCLEFFFLQTEHGKKGQLPGEWNADDRDLVSRRRRCPNGEF